MSTSTWKIHLTLLLAQLAFAGFAVVGKGVLDHVHPLSVASLRILVSTPLLFLAAWIVERRLPRLRDLPYLALLGFLGVFTNQILFIVGLEKTTATNASILMPSIPVFAAGTAVLFGIDRLSRVKVLGISLAVVGALVLVDPTRFAGSDTLAIGNGLILINCLSYGAFLVLQKPLLKRLPPLTLTAWAFLFGGIGIVLIGSPELSRMDPTSLPRWVLWGLAYVVIIPTGVGHAMMSWGVKRSSPSTVATYSTLQPILATGLAVLMLGETPGLREAVGFVLIVSGLFYVSRRSRPGTGPTSSRDTRNRRRSSLR